MSGDQMDEIRDWHDSWAEDMEELGDDDSDPPRIWLPDDCCPGCAFSRSLGDRVAKEVGVIALPELLDKQITENDEYVVLCSDGVFEFISNQMPPTRAPSHSRTHAGALPGPHTSTSRERYNEKRHTPTRL